MTSQQISDIVGDVQMATARGECHSCNTPVNVVFERTSETEMNISGGAIFQPPKDWDMGDDLVCKCDACFEQHPVVNRPTEVYSRVCGYMRPIKNWSDSKQNEFLIRKTFKTSKFLDNH